MCGIFGIINNKSIDIKYIFNAFSKIKPRGPDRSKIIYADDYFLGFHRLALNCLSINGDQPFILVDKLTKKSFYLLINGEIYNYKELANEYDIDLNSHSSDCSIILDLYKKLNYDFDKLNKKINGEYAMVIIELIDNNITNIKLSTDPLSVRPLFYGYSKNNIFGFSSKLESLSMLKKFDGNIKRLEQNEIIDFTFETNKLIKTYYKKPLLNLDETISYPLTTDYTDITNIFINCVRKRLFTDRKLGCLLSGGLDSSLVCAVASKLLYEINPNIKLNTFSIGMKNGTDIEYAEKVAKHLNNLYHNINHTTVYFTKEEALETINDVLNVTETWDLTTNRASVGQYLLAKYINTNTDIKVILNGDGADEAQMGYLYFYKYPNLLEAQLNHYKLLDNIHLFDGLRVDRCLSMNGLEARVPFLDEEFVDYMRSKPASWKVPTKERMEKYFIRDAFSSLYSELLPNDVLWRKKEAFSDGVSAVNESWYSMVQKYMNDKIDEEQLELIKNTDCINTKEAYYYWIHFISNYNEKNLDVIPYYWLPEWSDGIKEPSARVLNVYST
jgi:asparagine synthase (glutamine-hydrolysing)